MKNYRQSTKALQTMVIIWHVCLF